MWRWFSQVICLFIPFLAATGESRGQASPGTLRKGPLPPREELATFVLPQGLKAELVACEPAVVDPVAMAFDEHGRLYVAEMRGYPNDGVATGKIHSGKIKRLEDSDGDGFFEKFTVYAEHLRFPTSVMPWKGGILAAVAPDILVFKDANGDGRADSFGTLYTGFGLENIQQIVNGLQWGLDNWVYTSNGSNPSNIRSVERPSMPPLELRGRSVRFHPEKPGEIEPISGGGQFGLAADLDQHLFTATNSQHVRQIVLPDHYLRRNPLLSTGPVTIDIADHGAACKVFRRSPFEAWRVERTRRRAAGPDAGRFAATELVPGGYITSACGPLYYAGGLLTRHEGDLFVCDPANNLIHRDRLESAGAVFTARRADEGCEFLTSSDNWFRPVNLTLGPDGAIYVVDFYREAIETPLSLPDDIKKSLNLQSRNRGRIWRIIPDKFQRPSRPHRGSDSTEALIEHLESKNLWWRMTAQRLIVERQDHRAVPALRRMAQSTEQAMAHARIHALWTLQGLGALDEATIELGLTVPARSGSTARQAETVVLQCLRLAEPRLASSPRLRRRVIGLTGHESPMVRFQRALSLGAAQGPEIATALLEIARQRDLDRWTSTAVLSSSGSVASTLLAECLEDTTFLSRATAVQQEFLNQLAAMVAARSDVQDMLRILANLADRRESMLAIKAGVCDGLGNGFTLQRRSLAGLWDHPAKPWTELLERCRPIFTEAARAADDSHRSPGDRLAAVRLLAHGPFDTCKAILARLILPQYDTDLQLAAIRALRKHEKPEVADLLLKDWASHGPTARREIIEILFGRTEWLQVFLNAIQEKRVSGSTLDPFRRAQLQKHSDPMVKSKATKILAGNAGPERSRVVDSFRSTLTLQGDSARGRTVFQKNCTVCHRLENVGTTVGPELEAALGSKTSETLLVDIFDPSRDVDTRYLNYIVTTVSGRVMTGIIASESGASLTLRRADKAEDTILRSQIEEIQATNKSLMPENLEQQLSKQDVADLLSYLQKFKSG